MVLIGELIGSCYLYSTVLFTEKGKQQQQQIKLKERDVLEVALQGCFVHVVWCLWLMHDLLALSVAQRLQWGRHGLRGSHITGGNCHLRTRCGCPGCSVGQEDVVREGQDSQRNISSEQGS